jgi:hypothetical protein
MAPAQKRAAKSLIDVAFDRLGDAVGAGLVRLIIITAPLTQVSVMLATAMGTSLMAIAVASRLNRWYLKTLEASLVTRGSQLTDHRTMDASTARVVRSLHRVVTEEGVSIIDGPTPAPDAVVHDILLLRSGVHDAAMTVLSRAEGLDGAVVPHVIPLLASASLADYALFALRKVVEERVGLLTDAMLDPNQDDAVRRRLPRVFSVAVSQRAVDGLQQALDDPRFDVRFQVARSLAEVVDRNPRVVIDRERVFKVVLDEVTVSRPVWGSRRLLDGFVNASPLDAYVRDRAGQSLAHVFTLLSLVLPRQPLQIAFRSLHSDDAYLRGTALEYLEGVLPAPIRQGLWPFLVKSRTRSSEPPRTDDIANLLRSSRSLTIQGAVRKGTVPVIAGFTTH